MWKLIKISQQSYFIHCKFTTSQEVTFILYDLKETWCESLSFDKIKQNVKLLNKRYDFNDANIRETLLNGEIQTAIIEQQPHTSSTKQESCVVKLKYLVKNCPFHLEWSLRRQTLGEFQATFMQPLFIALQGCYQQVEILTEILRKKDAELTQYRKEGAVLHRKTLATKTFDFNDFNQKYKDSTELAANYTELAKFVINTKPKVGGILNAQSTSNEATKDEVLLEANIISTNNSNTKMSPKQRKRKVQELKQQQLERQLKARKHQFQYESSESQTTNSNNSQPNEEPLQTATKQKNSKEELQTTPTKENASVSGYKFTPRRKTARCAPIRNYEEIKSSDDGTDSDNDESNKITPRHRKSARNLNTGDTGATANSEKCKAIDQTKTSAGDTCDKSTKPPTLSYNKLKKTPRKSRQSLNNVYDFSTDSEYEISTKIRRQLLKTSPNVTEYRKTRSSPHVFTEAEIEEQRKSASSNSSANNKSKNLRHSSSPVADDISSQLDAIKKELKSLEALRLADLQQRTCKA